MSTRKRTTSSTKCRTFDADAKLAKTRFPNLTLNVNDKDDEFVKKIRIWALSDDAFEEASTSSTDVKSDGVLWQEKACKKLSDYYHELYPYKVALKRTLISQAKKLEQMEVAILGGVEVLIIDLDREKNELKALKEKRCSLVQKFVTYDETIPSANDMKDILSQKKYASTDELLHRVLQHMFISYLRQSYSVREVTTSYHILHSLFVSYNCQVNSVRNVITSRKKTFDIKFEKIDKKLAEKKLLVKKMRKDLKKESKNADLDVIDLRESIEAETQEKLEELCTPKIAKMLKSQAKIMKAWNSGRGEKCEGCNKVLKIDKPGDFSLHRACLKKLA